MVGDGRSWKVKECHERSFLIIRFTLQVRKVMGGVVQLAMLVYAVGFVGGL